MKPLVNSILVALFLIYGGNVVLSQSVPVETAKKIDSLFRQWDNTKSPGCAIGIVRNDSLIYTKGYGMANLEYGIPITTQTVFEMGSVSKQFTGFAIALLVQQGKLNLDDDIRTYLHWFPDMKQKITIRNLLTHTSGIRDHDQLRDIAGIKREDVITQKQLIRVLSMQKSLNFTPGEQYLYSNSGFTLAAEIVREVSGKSFRAFTDSAIFKPLGMNNTHFQDDYAEIIPNRAASYEAINQNNYKNSIHNSSAVGSEGLATNVEDMSKWVMNFYYPKNGNQAAVNLLTEDGKLNNGLDLGYGLGLIIGNYDGAKRYFHSGVTAGYRNAMFVVPDEKMGFIVFCNNGDFSSIYKVFKLSPLFLKKGLLWYNSKSEVKPIKKSEDDAVVKDTLSVKPYLGSYIAENGDHVDFVLENKKLYQKTSSQKELLIRTTRDTFASFDNPENRCVFKSRNIAEQTSWSGKSILQRYNPDAKFTDRELIAYTGKYYCPELDCSYAIKLKDHKLILRSAYYDDAPLTLYGKNHLGDNYRWMYNLNIVRNDAGKITGFDVNCSLTQDLRFNRVN